jgi:hypothetical protein
MQWPRFVLFSATTHFSAFIQVEKKQISAVAARFNPSLLLQMNFLPFSTITYLTVIKKLVNTI